MSETPLQTIELGDLVRQLRTELKVIQAGGKATGAVTQTVKLRLKPESESSADGRVRMGR